MLTLTGHNEDRYGNDQVMYSFYLIASVILDVVSHTIKEALVRSQPLNQENFNFQISAFQCIVSLCFLPFVQMTQDANKTDSPFYGAYYSDMDSMLYTGKYVQYGLRCVFGDQDPSINDKFFNDGECRNSFWVILAYCGAFFLI